jgi:polysaccharide pyruvyl transferase WcaK-like protein
LLDGAGIKGVEVVGDPVLAFALKDINPYPSPNSVGLNIGTSDGKVWGDETRIREEITSFARHAKKAGWRVEWFVVWPKDLEMTIAAAQASGCTDHIHVICEDHEHFIRETRRLTAFIGMKLHATVLATCALTPSIMLEYRPKCRDYMESIGQGHLTFRTSDFRAGELWEIVEGWSRHRSDAATALALAIHARQLTQLKSAAKAADLLESL